MGVDEPYCWVKRGDFPGQDAKEKAENKGENVFRMDSWALIF